MSSPDGRLAALLDTLTRIETLLADGQAHYRSDPIARLSLQRLWICAGEAAHRHCAARGIDEGVEPWSQMRRLRDYLAHHLIDEIDDAPPVGGNRRLDQRRFRRAAQHSLSTQLNTECGAVSAPSPGFFAGQVYGHRLCRKGLHSSPIMTVPGQGSACGSSLGRPVAGI